MDLNFFESVIEQSNLTHNRKKGRLTAPLSLHSRVYCGLVLSSTFCAPCSVFWAALCAPFFTLCPALCAVFLVACPVSLAACLVSWPASFISCLAESCAHELPSSRASDKPVPAIHRFTLFS